MAADSAGVRELVAEGWRTAVGWKHYDVPRRRRYLLLQSFLPRTLRPPACLIHTNWKTFYSAIQHVLIRGPASVRRRGHLEARIQEMADVRGSVSRR